MTNTMKTVQAVAMTALMVLSVVAISAPAAAAPAADLSASTNAGSLQPGDTFEVTYTLENTGADPGLAGSLEFDTPSEVSVVSASGDGQLNSGTVLYGVTGNTIASGDSVQTTVTFEVDSGAADGDYDVTADGTLQDSSTSSTDSTTSTVTVSSSTSPPPSDSQPGAPDLRKATHYEDAQEGVILELAFTEDVTEDNPEVTVHLSNDTDVSVPDSWIQAPDGGRVVVDTQGNVYNRIEEVTVSGYEDSDGNSLGEVTIDAKFAPETVNTLTNDNVEAFQGSNVTFEGNVGDEFDVNTRTDDDLDFSTTRGTGANSQVYVWNTDNRDVGDYRIENDAAGTNSSLALEDLGLTVEADEDTFEDDENVTATIESNDINREVDVDLLDSSGDEEEETTVTVDSDGEAEVDFGEVDTGNYTIEATDVNTQVTAESDEFEVVEAGDMEATSRTTVSSSRRVVTWRTSRSTSRTPTPRC
ncbi:NEW3 domain-containing protein [Haloarcula pelagica]|uniref:NEW3 domain-containing protein n=1 Tax=Halomicroarcula sp. GCM10025709 TaxID=3252669 RepID=UPI0036D3775D